MPRAETAQPVPPLRPPVEVHSTRLWSEGSPRQDAFLSGVAPRTRHGCHHCWPCALCCWCSRPSTVPGIPLRAEEPYGVAAP